MTYDELLWRFWTGHFAFPLRRLFLVISSYDMLVKKNFGIMVPERVTPFQAITQLALAQQATRTPSLLYLLPLHVKFTAASRWRLASDKLYRPQSPAEVRRKTSFSVLRCDSWSSARFFTGLARLVASVLVCTTILLRCKQM